MKFMRIALLSLLAASFGASVHASEVTPVISRPIPPSTGEREGLMVRVVLAPGEASSAHRHNAQTFVYVLSGTVEMAVNGQKAVTLKAGETFYESPEDVHTVSTNLDAKNEAVLLVFFVKQPDAPPTVPAAASSTERPR
jgi:quercetin dioxygenase-like cupin family protein